MNKTSLLGLAKKLNIPRRNCMKTKEELEEVIKGIITMTRRLFLVRITPPYGAPGGTSKAADHRSKNI